MRFGFSYVGLILLIMLLIPNFLWAKNQPRDYGQYVGNENPILRCLERIGEAAVSALSLISADLNLRPLDAWSLWLAGTVVLMILYELFWIRYFRSEKTMKDFYQSFLGIPVAGATLPVIAFFLLGIYGKNIFLCIAVVVLGIGHIGIHLGHQRELRE